MPSEPVPDFNIESLKNHVDALEAKLEALKAVASAARDYLVIATFPTRSDDCLTCGGGHSVVHQRDCRYELTERALRAALADPLERPTQENDRPANGRFKAVLLDRHEGWLVLSPWIETPTGETYRHRVWAPKWGGRTMEDETRAKHLAAELNRACGIADDRR